MEDQEDVFHKLLEEIEAEYENMQIKRTRRKDSNLMNENNNSHVEGKFQFEKTLHGKPK